MKDRIFVDTDIILDLLTERSPFYLYAAQLFTLADHGELELCISSLCFNNLHYMLSKQLSRTACISVLSQFKRLVTVLAVDNTIIDLALNSTFPDFEDAIQYFTAVENEISIIVTCNLKDYKKALIPVMTAEMYLKGTERHF